MNLGNTTDTPEYGFSSITSKLRNEGIGYEIIQTPIREEQNLCMESIIQVSSKHLDGIVRLFGEPHYTTSKKSLFRPRKLEYSYCHTIKGDHPELVTIRFCY